jgi:DNA-binding transcriptional ArsR family regulator
MENFESVAGLIGEPARARMLWSLLDGKAYTATELALCADVTSQNASMHLSKLVQAGLLSVEKQGRHRYYRFSRADVAYAIEAIASLAPTQRSPTDRNENRSTEDIRFCRTCYDHLAGKVAVAVTQRLLKEKLIVPKEKMYEVSTKGEKWFSKLGVDVARIRTQKRIFAQPCLDWSERRHHLAGALGAALLAVMVERKWVRKLKQSRVTVLTAEGQLALHRELGLIV